MAVNLSALQFNRSDLLDAVARALADSGLNPGCLELELTESILIQDADSAMKMVEQLRAMGLKLSIDDFGTGYSSLRYLQKLPVQKLKIDQSFVRALPEDGDSRAIVRAIVQLAHSLQLITVAEGVETAAQFEFLRGEGCDQVQGYYIDRPLPAAEFAALLARQQPGAQA
jgi:EAL domain-containing protein (putative c-di-GMP-specific phosphodiesterase class I)